MAVKYFLLCMIRSDWSGAVWENQSTVPSLRDWQSYNVVTWNDCLSCMKQEVLPEPAEPAGGDLCLFLHTLDFYLVESFPFFEFNRAPSQLYGADGRKKCVYVPESASFICDFSGFISTGSVDWFKWSCIDSRAEIGALQQRLRCRLE